VTRRLLIAFITVVTVLSAAASVPTSGALFTATTTNGVNTWGSASSYPSYQTQVQNAAWAYHRMNETQGATGPQSFADSATGARPASTTYSTDGPSTWLKLDGGTRAADYSGAVNDASVNGTTTWTTGLVGQAASLTPQSPPTDYLETRRASVATNASFTVMAWVYLTNGTADRAIVSQVSGAGTPQQSGFILRYASTGYWQFVMSQTDTGGATSDIIASAATAQLNTWVHVTGEYDASTGSQQLWINGYLYTSTTHSTAWNATGRLQVGRALAGGAWGSAWSGLIDDVQVYQHALTGSEVRSNYGRTAVTRWNLDEASGSTAPDTAAFGLNNTGTLGAGATWTTYISGAVAPVDPRTSFSLSAWVNLTGTTNQAVLSQNGSNVPAFALGIVGGKWNLSMPRGDSGAAVVDKVDSSVPVVTGQWIHLCAAYDAIAGTMRLHANTAASWNAWQTASHTSTFPSAGTTQVGRSGPASGYGNFLGGAVDEIRLFRWALTTQDCSNLRLQTGGSPGSGGAPVPVTAGQPGALTSSPAGTAVSFTGSASAYNTDPVPAAPLGMSVECWVRYSGPTGGPLVGFSSSSTGATSSDTVDRILYIDVGDRVSFGVLTTGGAKTVRSTATVNDAAWHHVVGSAGPSGIVLYLDGVAVDSLPGATLTAYAGFWRLAGAYLGVWPNKPATNYLIATLDEVAIYHRQLTASEVSEHYQAAA
jgi:hypothetical protein